MLKPSIIIQKKMFIKCFFIKYRLSENAKLLSVSVQGLRLLEMFTIVHKLMFSLVLFKSMEEVFAEK